MLCLCSSINKDIVDTVWAWFVVSFLLNLKKCYRKQLFSAYEFVTRDASLIKTGYGIVLCIVIILVSYMLKCTLKNISEMYKTKDVVSVIHIKNQIRKWNVRALGCQSNTLGIDLNLLFKNHLKLAGIKICFD